ncbi:MAG TPA: hypothetical protein VKA51_11290 [Rubrobacteraceae bacterium]|nr:hypothetical protein [Rubrobacteraceae bacterium]
MKRERGFGRWRDWDDDAGFRGRGSWGSRGRHGDFFGLDVESVSPGVQVAAALAVLAPVVLSGVLLVAFFPGLWWIFPTYGWISFPAFGLLVKGLVSSSAHPSRARAPRVTKDDEERELLEALRKHRELSPVLAATETSLSVARAEAMLKGLAEGGHLEARVRGGGLSYALWESVVDARDGEMPGITPEPGTKKRGAA